MKRKSIQVPGLDHGAVPIPQASRIGPMLVSGGINGRDPATGETPATLEGQADLVFVNIRRVLEAAGGTVDDVVKCTFFVRDRSSRPAIDAEWVQMFPDPDSRPARHTIPIELVGPTLLQAEVMAYIEDSSSGEPPWSDGE